MKIKIFKTDSRNGICENCRWWRRNNQIGEACIPEYGTCHHKSPVGYFPETYKNDFCSKFEEREKE